jgi:hypothetical protein
MKAILRLTIPHQVAIPLSGAEIADLFWNLDAHAQSEFFNHLARQDRLVFQLQAVSDCDALSSAGRIVMARIGEHSPRP